MDFHFLRKDIKNYCSQCYLHFITFSLNIVLQMIEFYDEFNVIPFDERTKIKKIYFEVIDTE